MISLIEAPQRGDTKIEYIVNDDVLTVKMNDETEVFDFTGFEEGIAEEVIPEVLPTNPIISAEKTGDEVVVTVLRLYSYDEKHLFEKGGAL